jgi:hypothetical protein
MRDVTYLNRQITARTIQSDAASEGDDAVFHQDADVFAIFVAQQHPCNVRVDLLIVTTAGVLGEDQPSSRGQETSENNRAIKPPHCALLLVFCG